MNPKDSISGDLSKTEDIGKELGRLKLQQEQCLLDMPYDESNPLSMVMSNFMPIPLGKFKQSDWGNAQRLIHLYGENIRYCYPSKKWYIWNGRFWEEDRTGYLYRLAKDTVRAIYDEVHRMTDPDYRKPLAQWAMSCEFEKRQKAMIKLAESEPGVPIIPEQFDSDPYLLNVLNGSIDLKTGNLKFPERTDYMTKIAPVRFEPDNILALWDKVLDQLTGGNQEFKSFLQRAAGYSISGDTSEEVLFFIHGPAASGKSTFLEAIKATLGGYAKTADFQTFLKSNKSGPRNDIARLKGARFVSSLEVDEGKALAEGIVKAITGGDTVSARFLHQEFFEFRPSFKLWLAANHAPRVKADDDAMWRRIIRIPFDQVILPEKRDPEIKKILCNPERSGSTILNWLIKGFRKWQEERLDIPDSIQKATQDYRQDMNPVKDFIDSECELFPEAWTSSAKLWERYQSWTRENGVKFSLSRKKFGIHLEGLGLERYQQTVGSRARGYKGIKFT